MNTRVLATAACAAMCWAAWHPPVDASSAADQTRTRWFRYLMGTSMRVEVFGGTAADREAAAAEAFGAIAEVDRVMSNYRSDSELTRVNMLAASGAVPISAPLLAILDTAERVSAASGGAFDVTVGPLMRLWGFKTKQPHVPTATELAAVRGAVGFQNVALDRRERTVRFTQPGVEIDLGGIAKGFASELAAEAIQRRGLTGLVDAGGNQYMIGRPVGKAVWSVGIGNPGVEGELLGVLDVEDGALSTSSDASNFLQAGGRSYGHLLDPRTLSPSNASMSATVVSRDGTLADALSKAAFVLGPRDGLALLESMPGVGGVIAYRETDGRVGLAVSSGLVHRFHRITRSN